VRGEEILLPLLVIVIVIGAMMIVLVEEIEIGMATVVGEILGIVTGTRGVHTGNAHVTVIEIGRETEVSLLGTLILVETWRRIDLLGAALVLRLLAGGCRRKIPTVDLDLLEGERRLLGAMDLIAIVLRLAIPPVARCHTKSFSSPPSFPPSSFFPVLAKAISPPSPEAAVCVQIITIIPSE